MQRANVTVDPSEFQSPVPAGYAATPRSIRRRHSVTVDELMHRPEESSGATVPPTGQGVAPPDLLAIFIERTSGAPIERYHATSYVVCFLAVLGATLLYHGNASSGGFELFTAAGFSSFAAAAAMSIGIRSWLTDCLRETAIDIGIPQAEAHEHARAVMQRLTDPSARRT